MYNVHVFKHYTNVHVVLHSNIHAATGSLCEELWQEVPPGAGQVSIPQRNDPIHISQGEQTIS